MPVQKGIAICLPPSPSRLRRQCGSTPTDHEHPDAADAVGSQRVGARTRVCDTSVDASRSHRGARGSGHGRNGGPAFFRVVTAQVPCLDCGGGWYVLNAG